MRRRIVPAAVLFFIVVAARAQPRYERLTYRRELVGAARFAPDGRTIVYTAAGEEAARVFMTSAGNPEGRPLT